MPTLALKKVKFNNGEIAPLLYGDTSHPKHDASLRACKNWLPVPQGALVKRPGMPYIAPVKDQSYAPRLIPFVFSDTKVFIFEFGDLYLRVYQDTTLIGDYPNPTVFSRAMLPYLKFAQVGNTITICYGGQVAGLPGVVPQDVKYDSAVAGIGAFSVNPTQFLPLGQTLSANFTYNVPAWSAIVSYSRGERVKLTSIVGPTVGQTMEFISIQDANLSNRPPDPFVLNASFDAIQGSLWWMPVTDKARPSQAWEWTSTAVIQDPSGITYETSYNLGPSGLLAQRTSLFSDRPVPLLLPHILIAATWVFLYYRVYRRRQNGVFGWVQDVAPVLVVTAAGVSEYSGSWTDDGREPDITQQPQPPGISTFVDPFRFNGADSYPSVVGHYDQRRIWAATVAVPQLVVASKAGDLYRYDRPLPGADSDSALIIPVSEVLEQTRAIVPLRRCLLLTGQGEWTLSGANGAPISKSNQDMKRQTTWGSSWVNPIIIGNGVLFNTAINNAVRDFYPLYGTYLDIWDGQDLTVMARHFFDLHTIVNWGYQKVPYPLVWAVRNDGLLLSLTYQHAPPSFGTQLTDGIVAWAQHQTGVGQDAVEEICVAPNPPDHAVYMVVKRVVGGMTKRYFEKMASPICPASPSSPGVSDPRYGVYLDSSILYDGHATVVTANLSEPDDPAWDVGTIALVTTGVDQFVVADAGASAVVYDPDGNPLECNIIEVVDARRVHVQIQRALTAAEIASITFGLFLFGTNWALAKSQITAAHLSGYQQDSGDFDGARGVHVLADGNPADPKGVVWAGGVATLQRPASVIRIGISYNADGELLDVHIPSIELRSKFKNLNRIGFEVGGARDLWVGESLGSLWQWKQRKVADSYQNVPLAIGYFEEYVTGEWGKECRAAFRHFDPLPCTIHSILREVEVEGE